MSRVHTGAGLYTLSSRIKQVVTIDGLRYFDCCMEFGMCSAACIWCTFMGLVVWIAIHMKNLTYDSVVESFSGFGSAA
jgi:hypothetical protein